MSDERVSTPEELARVKAEIERLNAKLRETGKTAASSEPEVARPVGGIEPQQKDSTQENEAKLIRTVKDLQEICRLMDDIGENLFGPMRNPDDREKAELLHGLQRDLIGNFVVVAQDLFRTASDPSEFYIGDFFSDLNLFSFRCQKAVRPRGGRVKRGRARLKGQRRRV